jgi:hypothetical protein
MGFLAVFLPTIYFGALGSAAAVVLTQLAQLAFALRYEPAKLAVLLPVLPFCGGAFFTTWTLIFSFFGEYLVKFGCDASQFSIFTCDSLAWQAAPGGDTFIEAYRMASVQMCLRIFNTRVYFISVLLSSCARVYAHATYDRVSGCVPAHR